jgi:hypothetical protein
MKLRLPLIAVAVAGILAMSAGSVLATIPGTPDAAQTAHDTNLAAPAEIQVQTFVAKNSGSLGTVLVYTHTLVPTPPPGVVGPNVVPNVTTNVTVAIFPTSGGFPTGSAMATQVVTPVDGGWTTVTFASPANVVATTKYALELAQGATDTTMWDFACADNYGPGTPYILDGTWKTIFQFSAINCLADFAFQTFVVTPPPPVTTAPPTSTSSGPTGDTPGNPSSLLIFAGLASAAVFVSISRRRLAQK